MKKTWKKLFQQYPEIEVIDLDFDFDSEEVKQYVVGKILPVLIVFKNDVEIKRIIGEKSLKEMLQIIEVLDEMD